LKGIPGSELTPDPLQHTAQIAKINFFESTLDKTPTTDTPAAGEDAREDAGEDAGEETTVDVETLAPDIIDDEFEFDWPNEEIRVACEAMLPKEKDILPFLDYIPKEMGAPDINSGKRGDAMEDVQC
jgi:hypothetical protein